MGFKKPLEINDIKMKICKAHVEITSPYNDGFVTWGLKKEFYEIKWLIDECIRSQPTFTGEEEWLEEQDKKRVWSELKR